MQHIALTEKRGEREAVNINFVRRRWAYCEEKERGERRRKRTKGTIRIFLFDELFLALRNIPFTVLGRTPPPLPFQEKKLWN